MTINNNKLTPKENKIMDDWIAQIITRFFNMSEAGVDTEGLKRAHKMAEGYYKTGSITPGEFEYLFHRTHPKGQYPKYVKMAGMHKKYGDIDQCPVELLITKVVDWRSHGANKVMTVISGRLPDFWKHYSNRLHGNHLDNPLFQWRTE